MLQSEAVLKTNFSDYFLLYKPRQVVSGDFYWIRSRENKVFCMAADSTGHGVPGAFVSMLGIAFLNEIQDLDRKSAAAVLETLREKVKSAFSGQTGKKRHDGMDVAFCIFDKEKQEVNYAGANNPLWLLRKGELQKIKATPNAIGHNHREKPFEDIHLKALSGDRFYLFSDGITDQLGGAKYRKLSTAKFADLVSQPYENLHTQKQAIEHYLATWQGDQEQTDDILVVAIHV